MKTKFVHILSLILAGLLQVSPLLRSFLPNAQGLAPNAWGFILKIGVGATALIGFDSISKASGISISPPNATAGQPYIGTVTYSGTHAGAVSSMSYNGTCLGGPTPFVDGLTIQYKANNTATVSGTPTSAGSYTFSITAWNADSCGTGQSDSKQHATLIVASGGTTPTAPSIIAVPQNTCAQVGADVQLSGGASGYPTPQYQWWTAFGVPILGATNSILTLTNVQLTNAALYWMSASNSSTAGDTFLTLPKTFCYLSVAISGGTNFSALDYTNYAPAGLPLTMFSWLTNGTSTTTNYYTWLYNLGVTVSTSNTYPISAASLIPRNSGTYTVVLSSTNSGGVIVNSQQYDSYWEFGYLPLFTNALPASTNVNAGSSVSLTIGIRGNLNVQNIGGGASAFYTSSIPCVFWYQDGNLVASQIYTNGPTSLTTYTNSVVNASLTLNNVSPTNAGNYTVVVTNLWGSLTSSPVALSVVSGSGSPPGIATPPPANLSLLAGQSTAISVNVTGTPPFTCQWQLGGGAISDGGVYSGNATTNLILTGVNLGDAGNYTLAITNAAGAITSSVISLNIALPPSLAAGPVSPGIIGFTANTITGLDYVVESTTNLSAPVWVTILTNNTGLNGYINFQTNTTSSPTTFYHLLFP